jgi:hypothetical protein
MCEPHVVVEQDENCSKLALQDPSINFKGLRTTRSQEQRVRKLHNRKAPHVSQIYDVRNYAEKRELEREAIDQAEQDLETDDEVYETREKPFCKHRMLFDEFGEIIESRGC